MNVTLRTGQVEIPKGVGKRGLLHVVEELLDKVPLLTEVHITNEGKVRYTWYAPPEVADQDIEISFDDMLPYTIVRNTHVVEISPAQDGCSALAQLLQACGKHRYQPIGFVTGYDSVLWTHIDRTPGVMSSETVWGYPVYPTHDVPDDVLILCAGYLLRGDLPDTVIAYKTTLEAAHV